MRCSLTSLVGLVLALAAPPAAAQTLDPIDRGRQLIREGRYVEALSVLHEAKLNDPEDPLPYFYSGLALLESGQVGQASPELRRAIELDPSQPEYPLLYARIQIQLDRKSEAAGTLELFRDPTRLESLDQGELRLLADLLTRVEEFEAALGVLDRLEKLRPEAGQVDLMRGEVFLFQRSYDRAGNSYQKALHRLSDPAPAYYGLGVTRWKQGRMQEAWELLGNALKLEPDNREYRYHLGLVALDLGRPEEALRYLAPIEPLGEQFPPIYNALARAYRRSGDLDRSRKYLERFRETQAGQTNLRTSQRRADSRVRQAVENLQQGDVETARTLFEEALRIHPDQWTARKYLARIYLASRQWGSAWTHLSAMESLRPDAFDVHALLAQYWYDRSQPVKARPHAEFARRLNPGDAELRNLLGNIYLALGRREEAVGEYRVAVTLAPDREDFRLNYETAARPE